MFKLYHMIQIFLIIFNTISKDRIEYCIIQNYTCMTSFILQLLVDRQKIFDTSNLATDKDFNIISVAGYLNNIILLRKTYLFSPK